MKLFITGFAPFGGEKVNPAWEAVCLLPDTIAGAEIVKREVPVVFEAAGTVLEEAIAACHPDAVLCVGQAGGRTGITVERVAINLRDARIPDNDGNQPVDEPVRSDGPAAYFATLPVKAMVAAMQSAGIPASLSYTAGTYVCNDLMYLLLYLAERRFPGLRGGFVHVPFSTEQLAGREGPCMPVAEIAAGLTKAVEAIVEHDTDLTVSMGITH